ncbi:MAG TPA: hypothetical protein PK601_01480 [Methanothermobacter sp.]|nr:hypothetical protein [Methanothermobacter sp.]HPQ04752.1 hypothetical protein [Methanothermobacter sp.]HPU36660.1 hypothetical protein [Methanothermobacter sp.]
MSLMVFFTLFYMQGDFIFQQLIIGLVMISFFLLAIMMVAPFKG